MMKVSERPQSDQRARIGLEPLEARNLQSALVGGGAASAPLIQPPSSNNGAYCASVKSESDRVCHGGEGMSETVSVNF
jgi:hypothetical protein